MFQTFNPSIDHPQEEHEQPLLHPTYPPDPTPYQPLDIPLEPPSDKLPPNRWPLPHPRVVVYPPYAQQTPMLPPPARSPRKRQKRSFVWNFFKESDSDPNVAYCQLCSMAIPRGRNLARNTTNLRKHLEHRHSDYVGGGKRRDVGRRTANIPSPHAASFRPSLLQPSDAGIDKMMTKYNPPPPPPLSALHPSHGHQPPPIRGYQNFASNPNPLHDRTAIPAVHEKPLVNLTSPLHLDDSTILPAPRKQWPASHIPLSNLYTTPDYPNTNKPSTRSHPSLWDPPPFPSQQPIERDPRHGILQQPLPISQNKLQESFVPNLLHRIHPNMSMINYKPFPASDHANQALVRFLAVSKLPFSTAISAHFTNLIHVAGSGAGAKIAFANPAHLKISVLSNQVTLLQTTIRRALSAADTVVVTIGKSHHNRLLLCHYISSNNIQTLCLDVIHPTEMRDHSSNIVYPYQVVHPLVSVPSTSHSSGKGNPTVALTVAPAGADLHSNGMQGSFIKDRADAGRIRNLLQRVSDNLHYWKISHKVNAVVIAEKDISPDNHYILPRPSSSNQHNRTTPSPLHHLHDAKTFRKTPSLATARNDPNHPTSTHIPIAGATVPHLSENIPPPPPQQQTQPPRGPQQPILTSPSISGIDPPPGPSTGDQVGDTEGLCSEPALLVQSPQHAKIPVLSCMINTIEIIATDSICRNEIVERRFLNPMSRGMFKALMDRDFLVSKASHAWSPGYRLPVSNPTPFQLRDILAFFDAHMETVQAVVKQHGDQKDMELLYIYKEDVTMLKSILDIYCGMIRHLTDDYNTEHKLLSRERTSSALPVMDKLLKRLEELHVHEQIGDSARAVLSNTIRAVRFQTERMEKQEIYACATLLDPRFKTRFLSNEMLEKIKTLVIEACHAERRKNERVKNTDILNNGGNSSQQNSSLEHYMDSMMGEETAGSSSSLANYLAEPLLDVNEDLDEYWKRNQSRWPFLAKVAARYSLIPCSCSCEEIERRLEGKQGEKDMSSQEMQAMEFVRMNLQLSQYGDLVC